MVGFLGAAALVVSLTASAASFTPLPPDVPGEAPSGLEARVVRYNGSTNGSMTVEVSNPTDKPLEFAAAGLYFVPRGDPDNSPQRLGAVGPYEANHGRYERLTVAPGAKVKASLDVYCIDSHRASPTSNTPFSIARDRLPPTLRKEIDDEAKAVTTGTGGLSAPASKAAVQSTVWKNRDKKWIKLDGEGMQEAEK